MCVPCWTWTLAEYVDLDRTRTFTKASVRAFLWKPTQNSRGHVPITIVGQEQRRRRVWL